MPFNFVCGQYSLYSRDSDGAGQWSTFAVSVGNPQQASRVMISTSAYETWVVGPLGCPSQFGQNCPGKRGGIFETNGSTTWQNINTFTTSLENNLGYNST
jgi:hypothetical protein